MKTKLILIGTFLLAAHVLDSCKDRDPYIDPVDACFAFPTKTFKVGEVINFTNCSQYAYSYNWSFGDGSSSNDKHVQHTYNQPGTYSVLMTAYGETNDAQDVQQVVVEASTDLDLLVMYFLTDDPVSNCDVTLYANETDWFNFQNPIINGKTNLSGSIIFTDLNPVIYFIDAYKAGNETLFYSNENLGNKTSEALVADQPNYYNVYVELLEDAGASKRQKAVIRKIVPTTADDKYRKKYRKDNEIIPTININE